MGFRISLGKRAILLYYLSEFSSKRIIVHLTINQTKQIINNRAIEVQQEEPFGVYLGIAVLGLGALGFLHSLHSERGWIKQGPDPLSRLLRTVIAVPVALLKGTVLLLIGLAVSRAAETALNFFRRIFYTSLNEGLQPSDAPLRGQLLQTVISYKINFATKMTLLSRMDFEQLAEARQYLGSKKFVQLTESTNTHPLQVWRQIENIGGQTTLQGMFGALNRLQPPERDDPYALPFVVALEKEIIVRQPRIYREIRERLWHDYPHLKKVSVEAAGYPPFEIKAAAVKKIEGSILDQLLFHGRANSDNLPERIMLPNDLIATQQNYKSVCRIFKLLSGEGYGGDLTTWLDDIKMADMRFGPIAVELLEKELTNLPFPRSLENYVELCSFYVDTNKEIPLNLHATLHQLYLRDPHTDQEHVAFEERYRIYKLFRPHAAYWRETYTKNPTITNFRGCFLALPMEEFEQFFKDEMITKDNLKQHYAYFSLARGSAAQKVVDSCKRFASSLSIADRDMIFGYRQTPASLLIR